MSYSSFQSLLSKEQISQMLPFSKINILVYRISQTFFKMNPWDVKDMSGSDGNVKILSPTSPLSSF